MLSNDCGEKGEMPRLTAELIADSPQFTNAVKDWELDLRGKERIDLLRLSVSNLLFIFCRGLAGYMCGHSHATAESCCVCANGLPVDVLNVCCVSYL